MQKGDILLIKYLWDFPIGWLIRRFTHCQYNHVAWALDNNTLIELKAKGRYTTTLKKYLNKFLYKCKLVRIKNIDILKLYSAIDRAKEIHFDYPYSSAIINFILIKLHISKQLPRLSCSGFIAFYLADKANFYFNGGNTWYITPADIEKSKKVEDVSNELLCVSSSI